MAADPTNVRIGYAGKAVVGPVGTAVAPASLSAAWASPWTDLGLISDDGLTEAKDMDRNQYRAWGYQSPVRTMITSKVTTFSLTFIETIGHVLSLYHQVPVSGMTSLGTGNSQYLNFIEGNNTSPDERALGLDVIDGARAFRFIIPRSEVTDRGDIGYNMEDLLGYEMTFTALLASDGSTIQRMYGLVALPT